MVMTPKAFAEAMEKIQKKHPHDERTIHEEMDALMCKILRRLGYSTGMDIFEGQTKWYA